MGSKSKNNLRLLFSYYSYALNIFLFLTEILPPFLRKLIMKIVFGKIGKNVFIDYGVYYRFPGRIEIANEVTIGIGTKIFPSYHSKNAKIIIGNNVRIGPDVSFLGAGHDYKYINLPDTGGTIELGDNVWVGAKSIILQGVKIDDGAVIAAGSIVTKNVGKYQIVGGVPAKFIRDRKIKNSEDD